MTKSALSELQLIRAGKWVPDEAFADMQAMMRVIPLSSGVFSSVMTTRVNAKPGSGLTAAKNLPRLPYKVVFSGMTPQPVVPFSAGAAWLRAVMPNMLSGFEFDLMKSACWRLSCRVTRGSRERTQLAKRAFAAYRSAWPEDPRLARQPNV